ncbi:MAG: hypothetical protein B7X90_01615 [Novosphingobium sp. 17-62-19]|nr:MAG: hypothetical protein B7X90_01615 [Novosphingobium sp. 17-62-19]
MLILNSGKLLDVIYKFLLHSQIFHTALDIFGCDVNFGDTYNIPFFAKLGALETTFDGMLAISLK